MRKHFSWVKALFVMNALMLVLTGCQKETKNNLSDENTIPIIISESSLIQSRVSGSSFDAEDQIGLYIMEQPNTISDIRYVNNESLRYSNGKWVGEKQLYYPSVSEVYDFIAYYPYNEDGLKEDSSIISFEVASDQQEKENYMGSDLLIAGKKNVEPSMEPVALVFKHKLVQVNIELLPGDAYESASELLEDNLQVLVKGVATKTEYDFQTENFTNPSLKKDIIPFGEFVVKENKLVGVGAILVPQTIAGNHLLLEIKCGGKVYSFTFGTDHVMEPATKETYTLTMRKSAIEGNITTSIDDWDNDFTVTGDLNEVKDPDEDNEEEKEGFVFSIPDFKFSFVYKVMDGEVQLAEICREYLRGDNINNQAIVIYPVKENKVDLSKGVVAQLLQKDAGEPVSGTIHGGVIDWKIESNLFSYQQGEENATNRLYIDKQGLISFTPIENAKALSLVPDIIHDTRDNRQYPIVKVGTQYWMGENLYATSLIDGSELTDASNTNLWKSIQSANPIKTAAYSVEEKSGSLHYNYVAISSGSLAPEGWNIPSSNEWTKLKNYVKDREAFISYKWENATNLSGLAIEGWGYKMNTGMNITAQKAYFWADTQNRFEITDKVTQIQSSTLDGNSVRCIRK